MVAAAQRAGVHDIVLKLADGYETKIGAGGSVLSGGQRQRVGLARALYGDPALIILDEPNSNLDTSGEQALLEAMTYLRERGATVIVITHRMNVLAAVTKVLVLKDGVVENFGPRDQVLATVMRPTVVPQRLADQPPAATTQEAQA